MEQYRLQSEKNQYDVIVVGAGLAGLSCAYELASKKKRVLVLEAHDYVGGRTSSFADDGMAVESGMHRYIGYYSALPSLLKRCGISLDDVVVWEKTADILVKGNSYNNKVTLGLAPVFGFRQLLAGILGNRKFLSFHDKLSLVPFFTCGFASFLFSQRLDQISVAEYANRRHVSARARRLILEPLSTGIFFMPPENFSAYVFFGLFAPALPKFYKMRIGAFRGGMTDVMCEPIARKIRSLGGVIHLKEEVKEVILQNGTSDLLAQPKKASQVMGVRTVNGQEYFAPHTVIATTLPAAKKILSSLRLCPELSGFFRLPHMSAATIQMELDCPSMPKDITTFGPGTDMASFAEQSRTTFPKSKGRLSVILGRPGKYVGKSTEELLKIALNQLSSLGIHLQGHVLDARKVTEGHDFYSLDKKSQRLRPNQNTGIPGLILAGDYTLTSSFSTMEGAVLSGKKAAHLLV